MATDKFDVLVTTPYDVEPLRFCGCIIQIRDGHLYVTDLETRAVFAPGQWFTAERVDSE